jgi:predicted transcriptional regulator
MVDPSELMSRLLGSEVRRELLILFHKNPGLMDTVDGIARRIGRTVATVTEEAKDFVSLGLLRIKQIGESEVFFLDQAKDNEFQLIISNHIRGIAPKKSV